MPKRKTLKADSAPRRDGWENLLMGAGDMLRDKRLASNIAAYVLSYGECAALYKSNDMAARIVDRPAEDMTRKWAKVCIADDHDRAKKIHDKLDALGTQWAFRQALKWQRLYGGGGILIGANDGSTIKHLAEPLKEDAIRSVDYLTVFDSRELTVMQYKPNPLDKGFGEPLIYRLNPRSFGLADSLGIVDVHASRILRFSGPVATREDLLRRMGWGASVLDRVYEVIRNFDLSWDSASGLLADFAQAVYKIRGLADAIASDREGVILKRLQLMDISRSFLRGIALDAESEDFDRKPTPIAGLADMMDRFCNRLAAAADMPVSMLMGQAPAGLNATGSENTRYYYDRIKGLQMEQEHEPLKQLVRLLLLADKGQEPETWSVEFPDLWQLDDVQKAEVRSKNAQADQIYLSNGVVSPGEVAESRFSGDEYGNDLKLDQEGRDALDTTTPEPVDPNADPNATPAPVPQTGAPGLAPSAMPTPTTGAGGPKLQDTALNGAQIASALQIVQAVAQNTLPRDSGLAMLIEFFDLEPGAADKIMGTVGAGFTPAPPEPQIVAVPHDKTDPEGNAKAIAAAKKGKTP
jgi:phage-related protein (TIGR01555 family)